VVVAPEVAARIVALRAAGASLSEISGSLHLTPGEVGAVLRAGRVAAEVAEPIVASGGVGGMLLSAIRAARRAAQGVSLEDSAVLERAPKPPGPWDAMHAQVDQAFVDFLGGDYRNPLTCGGDAGPEDAA